MKLIDKKISIYVDEYDMRLITHAYKEHQNDVKINDLVVIPVFHTIGRVSNILLDDTCCIDCVDDCKLSGVPKKFVRVIGYCEYLAEKLEGK